MIRHPGLWVGTTSQQALPTGVSKLWHLSQNIHIMTAHFQNMSARRNQCWMQDCKSDFNQKSDGALYKSTRKWYCNFFILPMHSICSLHFRKWLTSYICISFMFINLKLGHNYKCLSFFFSAVAHITNLHPGFLRSPSWVQVDTRLWFEWPGFRCL